MTTQQEWFAALDKLTSIEHPSGADIADALGVLMERLNTVIIGHANRGHDDVQQLARSLDRLRDRLSALEQGKTKAVGDASDDA